MNNLNIFDTDGLAWEEEFSEVICRGANGFYIERIVSRGQASPEGFWYDQDTDEHLVLISGMAILDVEGKKVTLRAGDTYFLPAHVRHRVDHTSKDDVCIWLCMHTKPEKHV